MINVYEHTTYEIQEEDKKQVEVWIFLAKQFIDFLL